MDINDLRSMITLLSFVTFIGKCRECDLQTCDI